ncbi:MAG: hypothetical protein HKN33_14780 [Pyrinomonadaceae bacterium]|nr:hypothetical protein [Pyrinomonadaceae bacterium]
MSEEQDNRDELETVEDENSDIQQDSDEFETVEASDDDLKDIQIESSAATVVRPRRKPYSGMWGPIELGAFGIAALLFLAVALFYLLAVVPQQRELTSGQKQRDELDRELTSAKEKWGDIRSTETRVAKLITSAEDFESRALREQSVGTTSIYQRINVLINAYGLRNTSGPDYVPLETGDQKSTSSREGSGQKGRDKFRSIFPGIYISTTVEGSYPNVRRFIRDIETSSEFVAITSVEMEPSEDEVKQAESATMEVSDGRGGKTTQSYRKGRYRGNVVSLRIEMAAYFRRPADQRLVTSATVENSDDEAVPGGDSD